MAGVRTQKRGFTLILFLIAFIMIAFYTIEWGIPAFANYLLTWIPAPLNTPVAIIITFIFLVFLILIYAFVTFLGRKAGVSA